MSQPTTPPHEVRKDVREALDELERLRDTVRVRVHLAGMELKRKWDELDRRFLAARDAVRDAEAGARGDLGAVTHEVVAEITRGIREVRQALDRS
jgi:hypothetical protein